MYMEIQDIDIKRADKMLKILLNMHEQLSELSRKHLVLFKQQAMNNTFTREYLSLHLY